MNIAGNTSPVKMVTEKWKDTVELKANAEHEWISVAKAIDVGLKEPFFCNHACLQREKTMVDVHVHNTRGGSNTIKTFTYSSGFVKFKMEGNPYPSNLIVTISCGKVC